MRTIKSWWLILAFVSGFALAMAAEELILNWRDNRLEFSAPAGAFSGRQAARTPARWRGGPLRFSSDAVVRQPHAHLQAHRRSFRRELRCVAGETFKVTKLQSPVRAVSHLTATATEAWCFGQMSPDLTGSPSTEPLWVRLEIRAQEGKEGALFGRGNINESGISLTGLIDIFSRPAQAQQSHWGPYDVGAIHAWMN